MNHLWSKVDIARYALTRVIDVFVIGPASMALFLVFVAWLSGASPLRLAAEEVAHAGEMFRGAPDGYVFVIDMPASARPDSVVTDASASLPSPKALAARPRRLISVTEWVGMQADAFGDAHLLGVICGTGIIVLLRGYSSLRGPFMASKAGPVDSGEMKG